MTDPRESSLPTHLTEALREWAFTEPLPWYSDSETVRRANYLRAIRTLSLASPKKDDDGLDAVRDDPGSP